MNIIITGASSGIGFETARALSEDPQNRIVAIARRKEALELLKIESKYGNIIPISFDLFHEDMAKLMQEIDKVFVEEIDILINNAGYLIKNDFEESTLKEWKDTFEINLFSVVRLIQSLLPRFNTSEGAHIVNIASMGGIQGSRKFPGLSAYSASKAAINSLTESLAVELNDLNIRVNAISPGAVQTPMLEDAFPGFKAQVTPKEMSKFIADFAQNCSPLMNGRLIQASLEN
jgi:NAD(P)-dependent dehydrogenase (short-subunit alcohol dehydrogenase family)